MFCQGGLPQENVTKLMDTLCTPMAIAPRIYGLFLETRTGDSRQLAIGNCVDNHIFLARIGGGGVDDLANALK